MPKVYATLEDGRKIAMTIPSEHMEVTLNTLVKHAESKDLQDTATFNAGLPQKAMPTTINIRQQTCNGCEKFLAGDPSGFLKCTACNCNLEFKVMLKNAQCPLDKWGREA